MKDIQSEKDSRGIELNCVGIKGLCYPIRVLDSEHNLRHTSGIFTMTTRCPAHQRGVHMSRFVEAINMINMDTHLCVKNLALVTSSLTGQENVRVSVEYDYFVPLKAPVTEYPSLIHVQVCEEAVMDNDGIYLARHVKVPVTTLCPCSKEISEYGAHNQRTMVKLSIVPGLDFEGPSIDDMLKWTLMSGSAPVYPLLKRVDEKHVTEQAYNNPKFVEDVVRDLAVFLQEREEIYSFGVECTSLESIHDHQAFASYAWSRGDDEETEDEDLSEV